VQVHVDIRKVLQAIEATLGAIRDQTPMWEDIGWEVRNSVKRNFREEGRPARWQPLARSTLLRKVGGVRKATTERGHWRAKAKRTLHENKILTDSGDLQENISYEADATGVTVGSNKDYAAIHQFGGTADMAPGPAAIPARPYLLIQEEDYLKIAAIIERRLTEQW
jgi:phage virion morphogenesis protein